ncbi:MAG: hypothetical protein MUP58_02085 [Candidatus Nanohaloarchaeota archaeon QJJ-9]|nr:hypothetical protein [Candidatus Nanohaloarchaeota archaeon QJJ-9]
MENPIGKKGLEAYLVVTIAVLAIIVYMMISGMGLGMNKDFMVLDILVILLIGVNILSAIVELRILEKLKSS